MRLHIAHMLASRAPAFNAPGTPARARALPPPRPPESESRGSRPEQWRVLDEAHRKRNLAEYEGAMDVEEQLVAALLRVAWEVATRVENLMEAR